MLGGGFAGLEAAKALGASGVPVTVVDRANHHTFQPLLYQVATAGLSAIDVAEPIRRVLRRHEDVTVLLGEAAGIDLDAREVTLADGRTLPYERLLVATGATHSYFGNHEWEAHAPGLKTIEDALEIRRRILLAFERAELEADEEARRVLLTFVVVGGGPTGAELAGALAELARHTLAEDFRRFRTADARIVLLEAGERILPAYPEDLTTKARRQLEDLGVEVRSDAAVTGVDAHGVDVGEERIDAATVLWAAGVQASPVGAMLGAPTDRAGRVLVEPDLSVPGHPDVFVAGDLAAVESAGRPVPGVAPAAMQMGTHAAEMIELGLAGRPTRAFHYVDKGSMATLGRSSAIAMIRGFKLWGLPAWLAWLLVHIVFLIGFRNRVVVLFEWTKAYLTYGRSARLILEAPAGGREA
ncbi:MAG: NAD(P)/FAD-dependent oxidoreductase [Acidimicrobiia bacterium]|nr:NAD(P)/FAD-dependent oxidoreductase [Acidimicrobiia bacterium]